MDEKAKRIFTDEKRWQKLAKDAWILIAAAFLSAAAYHVFIIHNGFAPGGVNGIATMTGFLTKLPTAIFIFVFNLPICIAVYFAVNKRSGVIIVIYIMLQAGFLQLMEFLNLPPFYEALESGNVILAALAGACLSGFGSALMMRRFGALNGTFAISMLIRKKNPTINPVWISFSMDCIVVVASFFVYADWDAVLLAEKFSLNPVLYTFINLFVASKIIDMILQGVRSALKYEIITTRPEELSHDLMTRIKHGVTLIPAMGMYTHEPRNLLICVVRRRDVAEFHKILKEHPDAFAYVTGVSEVMGNFVDKS